MAGEARGGAAGVARPHHLALGVGQRFLDERLDEEPGAVVPRLFLAPDHFLEVGHALEAQRQRLAGEGIELLEPDDRDVVEPGLVARFHQVVGDLARAQHQPADLVVGGGGAVGQDAPEVALADEVLGAATWPAGAAAATWAS